MDACDVVIVGGGPAGSSCAWGLRGMGLRVIVLDKATFPRNKICGGWITPLVLQELEIRPAEYAQSRTMQPISGFRVGTIGKRGTAIHYNKVVSYGIRRFEFDEYLLRRCGAEIREGTPVHSVARTGTGWVVNGEIAARLLVGAGGHFCPIAKMLGRKDGAVVVAQEAEFAMEQDQAAACRVEEEVPELYFCDDFVGYGWCFRKGDFLNVGLGRLDHHELAKHVTEFGEYVEGARGVSYRSSAKMCGHAYRLWDTQSVRLADDAALLVGDAAGLAYARSGEGIRPAVESGLLAAEAIAKAQEDYSRGQWERYIARVKSRLTPKRELHWGGLVPAGVQNRLLSALLQQSWFCRYSMETAFLHSSEAGL